MSDLISREALKKAMEELFESGGYDSGLVMNTIDNAPTVPLPDFKEGYKQAILDGKTNFSRPEFQTESLISHYQNDFMNKGERR